MIMKAVTRTFGACPETRIVLEGTDPRDESAAPERAYISIQHPYSSPVFGTVRSRIQATTHTHPALARALAEYLPLAVAFVEALDRLPQDAPPVRFLPGEIVCKVADEDTAYYEVVRSVWEAESRGYMYALKNTATGQDRAVYEDNLRLLDLAQEYPA